MASTLALGPAAAAVLALLKATTALTAIVPAARVVDDVSARPTLPYVLVESGLEHPLNTMGPPSALKWGSTAVVQVRVVSQYRGEAEATQIMGLVKAALDGQPLNVAGYASVVVAFESARMLKDTIAGVVTREFVADFAITVHQS